MFFLSFFVFKLYASIIIEYYPKYIIQELFVIESSPVGVVCGIFLAHINF